MAEQWEHMIVQAEVDPRKQELYAYTADNDKVLLDGQDVSNARTLEALNELGSQGWQLVDTDHHLSNAGATSTYYLKRQRPDVENFTDFVDSRGPDV